MLNNVNIQGRLTNDPQLNQNSKNDMVAFSVACQRNFKNKQTGEYDADFIRCVAFGKTADFLVDHFKQGDQVLLSGEWRAGSYTNDQDQKIYTNDLNVNSVNFCGSKSDNDGNKNIDLSTLPFSDTQQSESKSKVNDVPF